MSERHGNLTDTEARERRPRWLLWTMIFGAVAVVLAVLFFARTLETIRRTAMAARIDTIPAEFAAFDNDSIRLTTALFPPGVDAADGCSLAVVNVLTDTDGAVIDVKMTGSYGVHALDRCVVGAAYGTRLPTGRYNGAKARVWVRMSYTGVYPYYWAFEDSVLNRLPKSVQQRY
jgi:hypothetical protein